MTPKQFISINPEIVFFLFILNFCVKTAVKSGFLLYWINVKVKWRLALTVLPACLSLCLSVCLPVCLNEWMNEWMNAAFRLHRASPPFNQCEPTALLSLSVSLSLSSGILIQPSEPQVELEEEYLSVFFLIPWHDSLFVFISNTLCGTVSVQNCSEISENFLF